MISCAFSKPAGLITAPIEELTLLRKCNGLPANLGCLLDGLRYCYQHVQAIMIAIDQYAETALGNRDYFLNRPHSSGGISELGQKAKSPSRTYAPTTGYRASQQ